jgi:hypothetical protein
MAEERNIQEGELQDRSHRLSVLVQLENGTIIRLQEQKRGHLSIVVSQGFAHKKAFKEVSSYANLTFLPDVALNESSGDLIVLMARFLVSFRWVVECLISGPRLKRRKLRDLLGDDTDVTGRTIVWGKSELYPVDVATFITLTPKKGVIALSEAIYPLESLRHKDIKGQFDRFFKEPPAPCDE